MPSKTLTAIYEDGSLKLPEKLAVADGDTVVVTIYEGETAEEEKRRVDAIRRARGVLKDELDGDAFIKRIRERRLIDTRPEPEL